MCELQYVILSAIASGESGLGLYLRTEIMQILLLDYLLSIILIFCTTFLV